MKPSTDKSMTIHVPDDLAVQLDMLVLASGRNKNTITVAAPRDYLETQAWQIQDIEQGVAEADKGEFASDGEVSAFFAKYGGEMDENDVVENGARQPRRRCEIHRT